MADLFECIICKKLCVFDEIDEMLDHGLCKCENCKDIEE